MSEEQETQKIKVIVAGNEIRLSVTREEATKVEEAAHMISTKFREISQRFNTVPPLKALAMVTLDYVLELLYTAEDLQNAENDLAKVDQVAKEVAKRDETVKRIKDLMGKVEKSLAEQST